MNQIILIGRLTKNPELKYTSSNKAVCDIDIAVNRIGSDTTDFISVRVWEKQAENLNKYQSKGNLIAVQGSLRIDKYQNEKGEKRYKTYVQASNIEYLSSKNEKSEVNPSDFEKKDNTDIFAEFGDSIEVSDDDICF